MKVKFDLKFFEPSNLIEFLNLCLLLLFVNNSKFIARKNVTRNYIKNS